MRHLNPRARRASEVENARLPAKERKLDVEFGQFERAPGDEAEFFRLAGDRIDQASGVRHHMRALERVKE